MFKTLRPDGLLKKADEKTQSQNALKGRFYAPKSLAIGSF